MLLGKVRKPQHRNRQWPSDNPAQSTLASTAITSTTNQSMKLGSSSKPWKPLSHLEFRTQSQSPRLVRVKLRRRLNWRLLKNPVSRERVMELAHPLPMRGKPSYLRQQGKLSKTSRRRRKMCLAWTLKYQMSSLNWLPKRWSSSLMAQTSKVIRSEVLMCKNESQILQKGAKKAAKVKGHHTSHLRRRLKLHYQRQVKCKKGFLLKIQNTLILLHSRY